MFVRLMDEGGPITTKGKARALGVTRQAKKTRPCRSYSRDQPICFAKAVNASARLVKPFISA
jgi:hypothetical protein